MCKYTKFRHDFSRVLNSYLSAKKEKELLAQIESLKRAKAEKKELEKEITDIEEGIKAFMDKKDVSELAVGVFTVRYADVETKRFDSGAFRLTHEELYDQYCKTSVSKRFTIT